MTTENISNSFLKRLRLSTSRKTTTAIQQPIITTQSVSRAKSIPILAPPSVRRLARELGISLEEIPILTHREKSPQKMFLHIIKATYKV
jgi:pyruvate/2-oxoglutarate dehydrogenase complex dihydrolipoamide acyltransferase (E2) component